MAVPWVCGAERYTRMRIYGTVLAVFQLYLKNYNMTTFYRLKKRFDKLGEMSESQFIRWVNDSILTDRGTKIRPIDDDKSWELILETVGGARNIADIIGQSVKLGIYTPQDSWFMYEPSERRVYSFSGPGEIRNFFEELICDEIANTDDTDIYTAQ